MKIALLGYGIVGGGVYRIIEKRTDMKIKYVLDLREFPSWENAWCTISTQY